MSILWDIVSTLAAIVLGLFLACVLVAVLFIIVGLIVFYIKETKKEKGGTDIDH